MKITILNTKDIIWQEISDYTKFVSSQRQQKIERFAFEKDKIASLSAGLLLRYKASETLEIPADKITINYSQHNKPYIENFPHYHFNLSHSGNLVVLAESRFPVGIDAELISNPREKVAKKYFTESENGFLSESKDKNTAFFRIWTSKESYVKMLGTGLSKSLKSFDIFSQQIKDYFYSFEFSGYEVTVCCENLPFENISKEEVSFDELMNSFYE